MSDTLFPILMRADKLRVTYYLGDYGDITEPVLEMAHRSLAYTSAGCEYEWIRAEGPVHMHKLDEPAMINGSIADYIFTWPVMRLVS